MLVLGFRPDLMVENFSIDFTGATTDQIAPSEVFRIGFSLTNTFGTAMEVGADWRILLSEDQTASADDVILDSGTEQLTTGASRNFSLLVRMPDALPQSSYSIITVFDPDNRVDEEGSEDNQAGQQVDVFRPSTGPLPDLVPAGFSIDFGTAGSEDVQDGQTLTFTLGVTSEDADTTRGRDQFSPFVTGVGVYLSTDEEITIADTRIAGIGLDDIAAGTSATASTVITLGPDQFSFVPSDLADGTYYLGAIADDFDTVSESDETNNTFGETVSFTIGAPEPENQAPTRVTLISDVLAPDAAAGTTVGILGAQDPDEGDSVTFALAGPYVSFDIRDGVLVVAEGAILSPDSTQTIQVKATDAGGLSVTSEVTITIGAAPAPLVSTDLIFAQNGKLPFLAQLAQAAYHQATDETTADGRNLAQGSAALQAPFEAWRDSMADLRPLDLNDLPGLRDLPDRDGWSNGLRELADGTGAAGIYTNQNAAMLMARSDNAIFLSVRGTNDLGGSNDDVRHWADPVKHAALLLPAIQELLGYIGREASGDAPISEIFITGHSLGGGLVEPLTVFLENRFSNIQVEGISFNSPGYGISTFDLRPGTDPEVTHIRVGGDVLNAPANIIDQSQGETFLLSDAISTVLAGFAPWGQTHGISLSRGFADFLFQEGKTEGFSLDVDGLRAIKAADGGLFEFVDPEALDNIIVSVEETAPQSYSFGTGVDVHLGGVRQAALTLTDLIPTAGIGSAVNALSTLRTTIEQTTARSGGAFGTGPRSLEDAGDLIAVVENELPSAPEALSIVLDGGLSLLGSFKDSLFTAFNVFAELTGEDLILGGAGNDWLYGLAGADIILGGAGEDNIIGGRGDDRLFGGAGRDVILGATGNDSLVGGDNHDILDAGANGDTLRGEDGNDVLYGRSGDDELFGGTGKDWLVGGAGFDTMEGGAEDDVYYVDQERDIVIEQAGGGIDQVVASSRFTLPEHVEWLFMSPEAPGGGLVGRGNSLDNVMVGNNLTNPLFGEAGNDVLYGRGGGDALHGGDDRDILLGEGGEDTLYGDGGRDALDGGARDDELSGGSGSDTLYGREGEDTLEGDGDNDTLDGGADADELTGGAGADVFVVARLSDMDGDTITDWEAGVDKIDLSALITGAVPSGAFRGSGDFTGTGGPQMRFEQDPRLIFADRTLLEIDANGDGRANATLEISGLHDLSGGDFLF